MKLKRQFARAAAGIMAAVLTFSGPVQFTGSVSEVRAEESSGTYSAPSELVYPEFKIEATGNWNGADTQYKIILHNDTEQSICDWKITFNNTSSTLNWHAGWNGAGNSNGQLVVEAYGESSWDNYTIYSGNCADSAGCQISKAYIEGASYTVSYTVGTSTRSGSGTGGEQSGGSSGSGSYSGGTGEIDGTKEYNFAKLLQYSLYFYDANMCGDDVDEDSLYNANNNADTSMQWRSDCHTDDSFTYNGVTYHNPGGFHDAGDYVKFGMPAAEAMSMLGLGYLEFGSAYDELGQTEHLKRIVDHYVDWVKKSAVIENDKLVALCYQNGDGNIDHSSWRAPENDPVDRSAAIVATSGSPATDIVSETAAALAINYMNFGNDDDYKYAKLLFEFAKDNNKSNGDGQTFYQPDSWEDEYLFGAAVMYMAADKAGDDTSAYLTEYNKYDMGTGNLSGWTLDWKNSHHPAALYAPDGATRKASYISSAKSYYSNIAQNSSNKYFCLLQWGSARYNLNTQLMALIYGKHTGDDSYIKWSRYQMTTILGNNSTGKNLVCGYNENSPKNPHHRAATPDMVDNSPSAHILYGALVGGPTSEDFSSYNDSVNDYTANEVALDYNACLPGVAAALYLQNKESTEEGFNIQSTLEDFYGGYKGYENGVKVGTADTRTAVARPVVSGTEFTYNGKEQGPVITDSNASAYTVSGTKKETAVGDYIITFKLKDGYKWSTTPVGADYSVSWKIKEASASASPSPSASTSTAPTPTAVASPSPSASTSPAPSEAAGPSETPTPSTAAKPSAAPTATPVPAKIKIAVPAAKTGLVYNRTTQTGVADGTGYTIKDGAAGISAGDYDAVLMLDDGYAWSDGTEGNKTISWSIAKLETAVSWEDTDEFTYNGGEQYPKAEITYAIAGDTVKIDKYSGYGSKPGTYTVKIESLNNPNYTLPSTGITKEYKIVKSEDPYYPEVSTLSENIVKPGEKMVLGTIRSALPGAVIVYSLDKDGEYTADGNQAEGAGNFTVYYKVYDSDNNEKYNGQFDVYVEAAEASFTIEPSSLSINIAAGEKEASANAMIKNSNTESGLTYEVKSSNPAVAVAKVNGNVVTVRGFETGNAIITITSSKTASYGSASVNLVVNVTKAASPKGGLDWGEVTDADIEWLAGDKGMLPSEITEDDIPEGIWIAGIPKQVYACGQAWKFQSDPFDGEEYHLNVYHGNVMLREGVDYRVKFKNNKNAGAGEIYVVGRGNYSGTIVKNFRIVADTVNFGTPSANAIKLKASMIKIIADEKPVYSGGRVDIMSCIDVGLGTDPDADDWESLYGVDIDDYRGNEASANMLKADYVYQVLDDVKAGNATVIIHGINGYTGTVKKKVRIAKFNISNSEDREIDNGTSGLVVDASPVEKTVYYAKGGAKPAVTVTASGVTLKEGRDYKIKYTGNKRVTDGDYGVTASFVISGKGNFTGVYKDSFEISLGRLDEPGIQFMAEDLIAGNTGWTGSAKITVLDTDGKKLAAGKDFTLPEYTYAADTTVTDAAGQSVDRKAGDKISIGDILPAGSRINACIYGRGYYESASFAVTEFKVIQAQKSISKLSLVTASHTYKGSPITLENKDIVLSSGSVKDFEILENSYMKNQNKGTASVYIRGTGEYGGYRKVNFKILPKNMG